MFKLCSLSLVLFILTNLSKAEDKLPDIMSIFPEKDLVLEESDDNPINKNVKFLDFTRIYFTKKSFQQIKKKFEERIGNDWVEIKPEKQHEFRKEDGFLFCEILDKAVYENLKFRGFQLEINRHTQIANYGKRMKFIGVNIHKAIK